MDDNGYEYKYEGYDFFERINYYVKANQLKEKREGGWRWLHESHPPRCGIPYQHRLDPPAETVRHAHH